MNTRLWSRTLNDVMAECPLCSLELFLLSCGDELLNSKLLLFGTVICICFYIHIHVNIYLHFVVGATRDIIELVVTCITIRGYD